MHFERISRPPRGGRTGSLPSSLTVEDLTQVFDAPDLCAAESDGKTEHQWCLRFDDGTVVAIWDYKGSRWSVGAHAHGAAGHAVALLRGEIEHELGIALEEGPA